MVGASGLTERFAKAATTAGGKSPIFYKEEVIGFRLQVRDNGRKARATRFSGSCRSSRVERA